MIGLNNVCSLSDFQRNTKRHMLRLKRSGKPAVLTVNGKAALVVQDAIAYQKLLEAADLASSVEILRRRLADDPAKDVPAGKVLKRLRIALGAAERA